MQIRTKKALKPVAEELFFANWVVAGINFSEVVSVDVLLVVLTKAGGRMLLVDSGTGLGMAVDCSLEAGGALDGFTNWGVVVAGVCVSVEGTTVDVAILGGMGGVGLVGGVGDCIVLHS